MATNEMPFRPVNWGGQDPHSPTTGHHQASAGAGDHWTERKRRGAAVRTGQMLPIPKVSSPLHGDEVQVFAQEWAADNAPPRSVARDMIIGGVLGVALTRVIQNRRGRR